MNMMRIARGHEDDFKARYGSWVFTVTFPADLNPIAAFQAMDAVCQREGWECVQGHPDKSFDRALWDRIKGEPLVIDTSAFGHEQDMDEGQL